MNGHRQLTWGLICFLSVLAIPQIAFTQFDEATIFTEMDKTDNFSAKATEGLKIFLESLNFDKDTTLKLAFSPVLFRPLKTMSDYMEAYNSEWFDFDRFELNGSVSVLDSKKEDEHRLGNWTVGVKFPLLDQTNPNNKLRILQASRECAKISEELTTTKELKNLPPEEIDNLRTKADNIFQKISVRVTIPSSDSLINMGIHWNWDLLYLPPYVEKTLNDMQIRKIKDKVAELQEEWEAIIDKAIVVTNKEKISDLNNIVKSLRAGFVWAINCEVAETANVSSATENDSEESSQDELIDRKRFLSASTIVSYRRFWDGKSPGGIDLSCEPFKVTSRTSDDALTLSHKVGGKIEIMRNKINDSSIVFAFNTAFDSKSEIDDVRSFKIEESLSIPLSKGISLKVQLTHEKPEKDDWENTPQLLLSWSWEKDGKEESKEINFF